MKLNEALIELRKQKERKFNQTVDLIINLKDVDIKKANISLVVDIPHKIKDKKVCGFLTTKSELVKTITKPDFKKYTDKALLRNLVNGYDFFIAHASLMPAVATAFGKVLGPAGKMPSPQLGIITQENPEVIKQLIDRISKSVKVRAKEASIKIPVGKANMKDEELIENIKVIYDAVVNALPTKKENVKKVLLKLTMTKPIGVEL
ncbi:hypothetical protein AUJ84_02725 [Candidatus Pacearchaeota archaeon CG1_02_32_132]|nr:MAG: hypothetical protein AUJ84_02725 [Candidatus Pacearchaeota archaeon CG1_02_32_132]